MWPSVQCKESATCEHTAQHLIGVLSLVLNSPPPSQGHGLEVEVDGFDSRRGHASPVVPLDSYVPELRLVDPGEMHSAAVNVFGVLSGLEGHADGVDTREDIVAEGCDEAISPAKGDVQREEVLWVSSIGGFVHGMGLVADQLASHDDVFARRSGGFVEFDAPAVFFVGFGGEDEGVDLIASFWGELFEQRACVLGVCFFRWIDHGCYRGTTCPVRLKMYQVCGRGRRFCQSQWEVLFIRTARPPVPREQTVTDRQNSEVKCNAEK
jgi:hypothetical protein